MSLNLLNLDNRLRELMQEELAYDLSRQQLHISPYLSGQGIHDFADLLQEAIASGSEVTLAQTLNLKRRILVKQRTWEFPVVLTPE